MWRGRVNDDRFSRATLTRYGGYLAGSIHTGTDVYEIRPGGGNNHIIERLDLAAFPAGAEPLVPTGLQGDVEGDSSSGASAASTAGDSADQIQLLTVYTPQARAGAGGDPAQIEAVIMAAMQNANTAFIDSNMIARFHMAHMAEVSYNDSGDLGTDLYWLDDDPTVAALRDTYAADMVGMIVESGGCGIGYVQRTPGPGFASAAFQVTARGCAVGNLTFAHEHGHNMGFEHDPANGTSPGSASYPWSFGHYVSGSYRTVMSYSNQCTSSCQRAMHFSNPDVDEQTFATGIENERDNARTGDLTAPIVADFRISGPSGPASPSALSATALSETEIDLSWQDNANDETGFEIERSLDAATWSTIATPGVDTTAYSDSGLASGTTYYYRVRAVNGAGASGYSNQASATTDTPPMPPAAPNNLQAMAISDSEINLTWQDNSSDEDSFEIERSLDAATWSTIATLGDNTTAYSDSGLAAVTTYYYRVRATNGVGPSGYSNQASDTTTDGSPVVVEHVAIGQTNTFGTLSGALGDTHADDGSAQSLSEESTNGNPNRRRSRLEHRYTFDVVAGASHTLVANAWSGGSNDNDTFLLGVSTDGATFSDVIEITSTSSSNEQVAVLETAGAGTITVRVLDSDRTPGNSALDTLFIDFLAIRTQLGSGSPPAAPTGLAATATSSSSIDLDWTHPESDELGFRIERSLDGTSFSEVGSAGAGAMSFTDTELSASTTYFYRVIAFNGSGDSAPSNVASDTTQVGAAISLSLNGYKVKGKHTIDLAWSGATGSNVDIYRDSALLDTTANDGAYTDATSNKGGRTYTYELCEEGSSNCSDPVNVTF